MYWAPSRGQNYIHILFTVLSTAKWACYWQRQQLYCSNRYYWPLWWEPIVKNTMEWYIPKIYYNWRNYWGSLVISWRLTLIAIIDSDLLHGNIMIRLGRMETFTRPALLQLITTPGLWSYTILSAGMSRTLQHHYEWIQVHLHILQVSNTF